MPGAGDHACEIVERAQGGVLALEGPYLFPLGKPGSDKGVNKNEEFAVALKPANFVHDRLFIFRAHVVFSFFLASQYWAENFVDSSMSDFFMIHSR